MPPSDDVMTITIQNLELPRLDQLRDRLAQAGQLRCVEHGQAVVAVAIHGRENGWFDSMWTACCESLERQAAAIVKQRC